ncbi:MAG: hypothetical protein LBJ11_10815 [Oscillospiraceae bacterium]|nr:hypothetical protein [Oscillospiraceae bacterium]
MKSQPETPVAVFFRTLFPRLGEKGAQVTGAEAQQWLEAIPKRWRRAALLGSAAILLFGMLGIFGKDLVNRSARQETERTILVTRQETCDTVFTFVRDETLMNQADFGVIVPLLASGERAAEGEEVAVGCETNDDAEALTRLRALRQRLSWLTDASRVTAYHAFDAKGLRRQVDQTFTRMLREADGGGFAGLADVREEYLRLSTNLQAILYGDLDLSEEIAQTQKELDAIDTSVLDGRLRSIRAEKAGCFLAQYDGLEEALTPAVIEGITPSGWETLRKQPAAEAAGRIGKLVSGFRWYAVAVVSEEETRLLREGGMYDVCFPEQTDRMFSLRLESLRRENGKTALVFSGDEMDGALLALREAKAQILLAEYEGLSLAPGALRALTTGDGVWRRTVQGVYVRRMGRTFFREVELAYQDKTLALAVQRKPLVPVAVPGDRVTIEGTILALERTEEGDLHVLGKDLTLTAEDTAARSAVTGEQYSQVTVRRSLYDEVLISAGQLRQTREDGKLILTGGNFIYEEQRIGTRLLLYDSVIVKGRVLEDGLPKDDA